MSRLPFDSVEDRDEFAAHLARCSEDDIRRFADRLDGPLLRLRRKHVDKPSQKISISVEFEPQKNQPLYHLDLTLQL